MMDNLTQRIMNRAFPASRLEVVKVDVFPIRNGEEILLTFEAKNSEWKQGVRLSCDGGLEVNGQHVPAAVLWYETAPQQIHMKCTTTTGFLVVYNIWDRGMGKNSQAHSSGMLVEELPLGRRYHCNDIGFETNFDKLLFRIQRVPD
jgi:hypothetical protein